MRGIIACTRPTSVDGVKPEAAQGADLGVLECLVAVGKGVGDAAAALGQVVEPARAERLHDDRDGTRLCEPLDIDQNRRRN